MTKIGLTDSDVFGMILKDWIAYAAWPGCKIVKSPPHPDAPGSSALTLSADFTGSNVKPEPLVRDAICAASHIVQAIGRGQIASVEKFSVDGDEDVKYVISIKKSKGD